MLEQGLPIKQVLQNGPRYVVVSTEVDEVYALFKMLIPGAVNAPFLEKSDPELEISLDKIMLKEIRLLEFFEQHSDRLRGATPTVFRYDIATSSSWYLRELFPGKAAGHPRLPFRFDSSFYSSFEPEDVMSYIASIQSLTTAISPELKKLCILRWPNEVQVMHLIDCLSEDFNHPAVRSYAAELGKFISTNMDAAAAKRRVITHREPFGAHLFRHRGKLGLIDWERSSLGHPLFDPAVIWLRTLDDKIWQQAFYDHLVQIKYINSETAPIWDMLVLIDAIASYNFFSFNPLPSKDYHQHTMVSLSKIIESIVATRAAK